jgi:hypothetical protein
MAHRAQRALDGVLMFTDKEFFWIGILLLVLVIAAVALGLT